jgi:hypothetical protein
MSDFLMCGDVSGIRRSIGVKFKRNLSVDFGEEARKEIIWSSLLVRRWRK